MLALPLAAGNRATAAETGSRGDVKVLVINLERSVERRAHTERALAAAGIPFAFFPAVDGARARHRMAPFYDEAQCARWLGRGLNDGELGCFLSHYLLWKEAAETNEPIVVMEDDIDLVPGASAALKLALAAVEKHGIIRLSSHRARSGRVLERYQAGRLLVRFAARLSGTQCYVVSPRAAGVLLRHCVPWIEPVDEYMDRFWVHGIEIVGLVPFPVRARDLALAPSEIGVRGRTARLRGFAKVRRECVRLLDFARRSVWNFTAWLRDCRRPVWQKPPAR
jgi:glycosyl transferase family 25